MINYESYAKTAIYLFENNEKIVYYSFLESVKTNNNKVLVESIQKGFVSLFEDNANMTSLNSKQVSDIFKGFWAVANSLTGLVSKLRGNSPEETTQINSALYNIRDKKPGSGKLQVETFSGGAAGQLNPVTDFKIVAGDPDDSDSEKAKAIILSACIPFIVDMASKMAKTPAYVEAAKDFIMDLLTDELPAAIDNYNYTPGGAPFFQWLRTTGYKNAQKHAIAKAGGVKLASSGTWKAGVPYTASNTIVNWKQKNYKPTHDISAEENKLPPNEAHDLWQQYGKSTDQEMSTTAQNQGIGTGDSDDKDKREVGDQLQSEHGAPEETETNVDVKKLMAMLPDSPDKQALMMLYGVGAPRMTDVEIAEKLSKELGKEISRTTVHNMVKRALDQIRSKAKIHA